jgi:hypothetical protein
MAIIGARKIPSDAIKLRRLVALWTIFHGTIIQPELKSVPLPLIFQIPNLWGSRHR